MLNIKQSLKKYLTREFVAINPNDKYPFDVKKLPMGYFKSFGNKNADKIFYVIWRDRMGSGFFSNISHVLTHLKIADMYGLIPVVDFQNFKTLYNENLPIRNTENAWEYYFKPVSPFHLDEVYDSQNVFFCSGEYPAFMSFSITRIEGLYEKIFKKYMFLQNHVKELLRKYLDKMGKCASSCEGQRSERLDGRTVGIHFRGQEQRLAPSHSFPPTEKQMIKYTDEIIYKYNIEKIFLVTEEQGYLDLFIKRYGRKVLYTESFRTYEVNAYNLNPREQHRYLLGLDILIDAYLLSKCDGLLCGDSNVSEFARFINNGNLEFVYKIYNGTNSSNPLLARYLYTIKKSLPSRLGGLSDRIVGA